jgi:hypothetical protein
VTDAAGNALVTTYALLRPDEKWSLLIVNRDRENNHNVKVAFRTSEKGRAQAFSGTVRRVTFGSEQYRWHPDGPNGYPNPDGPFAVSTLDANRETVYELPKASITVLTGALEH